MTGCAIEFLGVYLITSKRNKQPQGLSIHADDTLVDFDTSTTARDEGIYVPENQTIDEEAATTNRRSLHFTADPTYNNRRSMPPSSHDALNTNRLSAAFTTSTPTTHEDWHTLTNSGITGSSNTNTTSNRREGRKRRSSVFRGISLTSQLVDRMNEEPVPTPSNSKQPIQLPPSSPTWQQTFGFHQHRRGDSAFGNLISGLTGTTAAPSTTASGGGGGVTSSSNSHYPITSGGGSSSGGGHDPTLTMETDADAVEIEIPTASTLSSQRNSEDDRELLPIHSSKRNSTRLVDIEENPEYRDLS